MFSASAAWSHSSTDDKASPSDATMSSSRRSMASAHAPPHNPNTTNGTNANSPDNPTYAEFCVNAYS